ncbi:MAG TPA: hypothetical protein VNO23_12220, partial [Candidatus Binatia bacterium]|nr:hypothetical protein [Candidatus Binatia bacterium]
FERIGRYRRAREEAEARRRASGRRPGRERGLIEAEPGRLALIRRKGAPTLGMILRVHSLRGRRVLVDALLPHGALVRVKAPAIKQVLWATPPLTVPRDLARHPDGQGGEPRGLRHLAEHLTGLDVRALLERERRESPEAALAAIECHRCPWGSTVTCSQAWREVERLEQRLAQRRALLEGLRNSYWQEFLRVVEVLEQFGAVRGRELEPKGRLIAGLRHDNELLVAEVLHRGLLSDLTLPEAAAVLSALTEEARSGDPLVARGFLRARPKLRRRLEQVGQVAAAVAEAQRQRQLPMPVSVHAGFMPAVFRWASGDEDWPGIVQHAFGGHEGDLIRAMRRLIDLLRQLAESPEVPGPTARMLAQAARVVDRGIVLESALM